MPTTLMVLKYSCLRSEGRIEDFQQCLDPVRAIFFGFPPQTIPRRPHVTGGPLFVLVVLVGINALLFRFFTVLEYGCTTKLLKTTENSNKMSANLKAPQNLL